MRPAPSHVGSATARGDSLYCPQLSPPPEIFERRKDQVLLGLRFIRTRFCWKGGEGRRDCFPKRRNILVRYAPIRLVRSNAVLKEMYGEELAEIHPRSRAEHFFEWPNQATLPLPHPAQRAEFMQAPTLEPHPGQATRAIQHSFPHRNCVAATTINFHDMPTLDHPPSRIVIVQSKKAMGDLLAVTAQAARVIEEGANDDIWRGAALAA